jgi:hypothetical protein
MEEIGKPVESLQEAPFTGEKHANYKRALETRSPEDIYVYVKGWGTRVKVNLERLKGIIDLNAPRLKAIENISLEKFDFNSKVSVNGREFSIHDIIVQIYNSFIEVGEARRGHTLISHILNVLNPHLFPHWDDDIREAYGCYGNAEGYCNFILRMRYEVEELVDSYRRDYPCASFQEAIERIRKTFYSGGWMPITRLIDMYNWWKYTKKKIDC